MFVFVDRGRSGAAISRPSRRRHVPMPLAVSVAVILATAMAVPAPVVAAPAVPTFADGLSQAVFGGSSTWINGEVWVESSVDSDFDGRPDRVHADITRVQETETDGLKVPVIMEVSPYYAGSAPVVNWSVDHELGSPPASRPVSVPRIRSTSPTISTTFESCGCHAGSPSCTSRAWAAACPRDARPPAGPMRRRPPRPSSTG